MKKRVLSWGTFMCDIIAAGLNRVAEPGVIEYLTQPIELRLGGHPVDLVLDLAQVGVDPAEIGFVSTVGSDVFGDFLLAQVAPYGFDRLVRRVPGGTGKTLILSVKGLDRMCHLDPAACMQMSLEHQEDALCQTQPEFFTLRPGYTNLDTRMASLLGTLRRGPLRDTFILLDLCAPYAKPWSYYLELLPHVDAVHGNRKEIMRAAGEEDFAAATNKILSLGPHAVLLTKEGDGAEIVTPRYRVAQGAFDIPFVEPSGCGDAFCGGIVYALMQQPRRMAELDADALAEALVWGQALGAAAATAVGCVAGVTQDNVRKLIETQKARVLQSTQVECHKSEECRS
jgi:sugar/nucleoside kinase (ribokinase family)